MAVMKTVIAVEILYGVIVIFNIEIKSMSNSKDTRKSSAKVHKLVVTMIIATLFILISTVAVSISIKYQK